MTCTMNIKHDFFTGTNTTFNASDLYFNVSGQIYIGPSAVQVENEFTAHLYVNLTASQHRSFVECLLNRSNDLVYIGQQYLFVGWEPYTIRLKSIFINNWNSLQFTWTKPLNTVYVTRIWSWWKFENESSFRRNCTYTRERLQVPSKSTCLIENFYSHLSNDQKNQNIVVKVNASNAAGKITTEEMTFKISEIIKPDKLENVTITPLLFTAVQVKWIPSAASDPYTSLMYQIKYFEENDENNVHTIQTENTSIILSNLKQFTTYTFSVNCKVVSGLYWSEPVHISHTTREKQGILYHLYLTISAFCSQKLFGVVRLCQKHEIFI